MVAEQHVDFVPFGLLARKVRLRLARLFRALCLTIHPS